MKTDYHLTSERLVLRPYKNADLFDLLEAIHHSQQSLAPWLPWYHDKYSQHDAHEWIHASHQNWVYDISYEFAIFERSSETFLGSTSLSNLSELTNSAEMGYWIRSSAQRKGYATEACRTIARFAFETVGLTRIEIVTHTGNLASQRTALATKARFECTARNRIVCQDGPVDGLLFSLIPSDITPSPPSFTRQ